MLSGYATIDFHRACEVGDADQVERILKSEYAAATQFNINCTDVNGDTALHKAARCGHTDVCRILCRVTRPAARPLAKPRA